MLKLEIKTGGAAFSEDDELTYEGRFELARLLRKVAAQIETGDDGKYLMDINGNRCGQWTLDQKGSSILDIIFYNKVNRSVIIGYKNVTNIPMVKDHIILNKQEYIVEGIIYDYENKVVHIFVRKRNSNDVTFYIQKGVKIMLRYGEKFNIPDHLMDTIATYMNDEKREIVHGELAPCTHEEFLKRYLELDPDFEGVLWREFRIEFEE